jgi:putative Holliday junction resolvase
MPEATELGRPQSSPKLVIAFDFGQRRIGIACGDTLTQAAQPLATLDSASGPAWTAIGGLLREWRPTLAVVGLPYNVDGSENAMTGLAQKFAAELAKRFKIRTSLIDERYSSQDAAERLRSARRAGLKNRRMSKADVDAAAACVILERWFALQQSEATLR